MSSDDEEAWEYVDYLTLYEVLNVMNLTGDPDRRFFEDVWGGAIDVAR
jgi:hypothetical protein